MLPSCWLQLQRAKRVAETHYFSSYILHHFCSRMRSSLPIIMQQASSAQAGPRVLLQLMGNWRTRPPTDTPSSTHRGPHHGDLQLTLAICEALQPANLTIGWENDCTDVMGMGMTYDTQTKWTKPALNGGAMNCADRVALLDLPLTKLDCGNKGACVAQYMGHCDLISRHQQLGP
jgi:hypothetical protein